MTVEQIRSTSDPDQPFRTVIVVVGDLKYQWIQEIGHWWKDSEIFDCAGVPKAKRNQRWYEFLSSSNRYAVCLVTWGSLRLLPELPKYKVRVLIADEAHAAKGASAQCDAHVKLVQRQWALQLPCWAFAAAIACC